MELGLEEQGRLENMPGLGWQQGAGSFRTLWTVSGVLIFALCSQQPLEQDPPGSVVAELFLKDPSDLSMESAYEDQEVGGSGGDIREEAFAGSRQEVSWGALYTLVFRLSPWEHPINTPKGLVEGCQTQEAVPHAPHHLS